MVYNIYISMIHVEISIVNNILEKLINITKPAPDEKSWFLKGAVYYTAFHKAM